MVNLGSSFDSVYTVLSEVAEKVEKVHRTFNAGSFRLLVL
jgi:hypothetical protein